MKTFKEYLAESTKTYAVRVKIAGDLPENFDKRLQDYMSKYETIEFKKVGTTPVQEHPHEFPRIKNQEVSIYDVEASYPISFQQLETTLADEFGISFHNLKVKHPNDPTEEQKDDEAVYGECYRYSGRYCEMDGAYTESGESVTGECYIY